MSVNGTYAAGHGQGCGIHDKVGKPKAHGALVAKDAFKGWLHCFKVEKRFIDVKDDQGKSGHVVRLRFYRFAAVFLGNRFGRYLFLSNDRD
jgi:hypothetical protein